MLPLEHKESENFRPVRVLSDSLLNERMLELEVFVTQGCVDSDRSRNRTQVTV